MRELPGIPFTRSRSAAPGAFRILQVTLGFLPAVSWGGTVQVVYQNSRELRRRGHEVRICASNLFDKSRHIGKGTFHRQVDGIAVTYLNTVLLPRWRGTTGPTFVSPGAFYRLWQETAKADVIHLHGTRNILVLAAGWFARWQRKPLIIQPHGTLQYIVSSIRLKRLYDRLLLQPLLTYARATFIALTPAEQVQIASAGGTPDRIRIVVNGLANNGPDSRKPMGAFRSRHQIGSEEQIVLFLGRLNPKKGPDLLVEAFARLPANQLVHTRLVLAGPDDGSLAQLRELVTTLELNGRVIFTGLVEADQVPALLADADLFALTCRTDTFPMALVEACAAGLPIVVTDTCEIADLLNGEAASVVPVAVECITEALNALLSDDALRRRFAVGGKALARTRFSIRAVGDQLESLYQSVV